MSWQLQKLSTLHADDAYASLASEQEHQTPHEREHGLEKYCRVCVQMSDFEVLQSLASGGFASVYLA